MVDLGCGPGWQLAQLGPGAVGLDAAAAMVDLARNAGFGALVNADLEALPFRTGSLGGAWASRSYIHVERDRVPLALADLHRSLAMGAPVDLALFVGDNDLATYAEDDFAGRRFTGWTAQHLADVMVGAGFADVTVTTEDNLLVVTAVRARTLPDFVGPGMRLLACGLNPSLHAADAGYGYAGPSNRFWKAVAAAGVATALREPRRMVTTDRVGMTCLVKRATPRADELSAAEYRAARRGWSAWSAGSNRGWWLSSAWPATGPPWIATPRRVCNRSRSAAGPRTCCPPPAASTPPPASTPSPTTSAPPPPAAT